MKHIIKIKKLKRNKAETNYTYIIEDKINNKHVKNSFSGLQVLLNKDKLQKNIKCNHSNWLDMKTNFLSTHNFLILMSLNH